MAQRRMIDKKISVSDQVSNLPTEAQLIFTWSIVHSDDIGLLPHSLKTLKATIVPLLDISLEVFSIQVQKILAEGLWEEFIYQDHKYYRIVKFVQGQVLRKDRQPSTLLPINPNKSPEKTWKALYKILQLDDTDIPMDDTDIPLTAEVRLEEVKITNSSASEEKYNNPDGSFNFDVYLQGVLKNPNRYAQIIGLYWQYKNLNKPTLDAARAQFKREINAAKNLTGYSNEQILATFDFLDNDPKRTYVWTLETVLKRVDNVINNRN